jgi:16S rRNA (guanine966-N2)-methyltransferase
MQWWFSFVIRKSSFIIRMRVIAGKFRGRRLKGPSDMDVRPTGDRLKETLFDIIRPDINGAVVLDVFGGTGAIGIEALSRGAGEVVFIENARSSCRLIQDNLKICGIDSGFRILRHDVFTALRSLAREGFKADVVFFDPPYNWKPYGDLLQITFNLGLVGSTDCVVIEHYRKTVLPESGEGYIRSRIVRQGDHCLSFFAKQEPGARSQ